MTKTYVAASIEFVEINRRGLAQFHLVAEWLVNNIHWL